MQAVISVALRVMVLGWLMCSPAFSQSFARVVVDAWFNSQQRTNAAGKQEYFHYKWDDVSNSGFFLFGQIFRGFGVATDTLYSAPTEANLKGHRSTSLCRLTSRRRIRSLTTCSPRMLGKWLHG